MANQAFSDASNLMVGAGELYFKRKDDSNGLHHLGNVEEFNITTDVTTVEKNSSMNKRRELMASVVTAVAPSGSLTMTEYNPYNLALGLFGAENVHKQEAQTLTDKQYVVPSVPGIIELVDDNKNRFYNIKDVSMKLAVAIPSTMTTATDFSNVASGTTIAFSGTYAGATDTDIYVAITKAATTAGDVEGIEISWSDGIASASTPNVITVTETGSTVTKTLGTTGVSIDITLGSSDDLSTVVTTSVILGAKVTCVAAKDTLTKDVDYMVEEQSSRAGMIKIPAKSALKAGDGVLITVTIPESDFVTVSGGNAGEIEGELIFIGDPNQGDIYNIEAWDVKVQPDGDLSGLISDDFGSFNLTIKFLADYQNHPSYPYYKVTKVGSASGTEVASGTYDPLN